MLDFFSSCLAGASELNFRRFGASAGASLWRVLRIRRRTENIGVIPPFWPLLLFYPLRSLQPVVQHQVNCFCQLCCLLQRTYIQPAAAAHLSGANINPYDYVLLALPLRYSITHGPQGAVLVAVTVQQQPTCEISPLSQPQTVIMCFCVCVCTSVCHSTAAAALGPLAFVAATAGASVSMCMCMCICVCAFVCTRYV